ncbi:MAG: 50S ribosomal protein L3 N(5)-glutamine methyltransferase [Candidatus Accumulibacter sp.]|mgnify:FL=1|uniref:50S ribosomal protein L3 N(5)-glutamine methyltransferase n=1 Tax=Accumulibacter sp. TaxID=2053492 RepID=UPI002878A26D|nr:50S ribosomal protein L3 N(5)-glutamine methyltransferase [Accumulibacter sp.]MDS4014950.1 50S ribosomal protein L3 N(5)-glutamine methyltransferase [Accumulibacter sp.]
MSDASRELRTLRDLMRFAVSRFNEAGVFFGHGTDNAWDEAAYLLLHCLHLPLDRLEPFLDARLTRSERARCLQLITRRIGERLPAAYLTNEAWLGEYRFYVDPRVIVPRSFIGELLRERLTPWIAEPDEITSILDLCTGSACLAIIAAHVFPAARIDAVDVSADALAVARRNVADHALDERVQLIESDLFAGLRGRRYDLIVSNPPYVDAATMATLPAEYRCEPELALASGDDGLDLTRAILARARQHLAPHGLLVVEIGHNRDTLEAAFPKLPFTWLETSAGDHYVFLLQREELPR